MSELGKQIIHHEDSTIRISFDDSYVIHSWDFFVSPGLSINDIRKLVEDALKHRGE